MKLIDRLEQDKEWIDKEGRTHKLKELEHTHVRHIINWLENSADQLHKTWFMKNYVFIGDGPQGDAANDAFDQEFDYNMTMNPQVWLDQRPLVKALRKRLEESKNG